MENKKSVNFAIVIFGVLVVGILMIIKPLINKYYLLENEMSEIDRYEKMKLYNSKDIIGETTNNRTNFDFSLTGVETIWELDAIDDGIVNVEYLSDIKEGNFKVSLVKSNNEVVDILNQSEYGETEIEIPKGKSIIQISGEGSKGNLQFYVGSKDNILLTSR